jgi:hypothetical protein
MLSLSSSVFSQKTKRETVINVESSSISPDTFTAMYYPRPDDAGLFSVVTKQISHISFKNNF